MGSPGLLVSDLSNHVRLSINVRSRSRENKLVIEPDGTFTLHVVAPPVEGKANTEVVRSLAKRFGKTRSQVRIVAGLRSNVKIVEIADISKAEILRLIARKPD